MKRFLLFDGDTYYPAGGWHDFAGSFDTLDEAQAEAKNRGADWFHIVDSTKVEPEIVEDN